MSLKNNKILQTINNHPASLAIAVILSNIGGRYVDMKFSPAQEHMLRRGLGRELLLFAVVFITTRDIIIALITTIIFFVLANYIFNEKSSLCVCPNYLRVTAQKEYESLHRRNSDINSANRAQYT